MRITPLIASAFRSDGGSMFGLVPRPIWAKRIPPDERHRIPQHAHALLVQTDDGTTLLVDSGCGPADHFTDKERELHALGPGWPLADALRQCGAPPEQLDMVTCTHLHWDHAGAVLGASAARFAKARYVLHRQEVEDALSGDELLYKSYPEQIVDHLRAWPRERLRLLDGECSSILSGISLLRTGGHTRGHCAILFEGPLEICRPGGTVVHRADLALFAGDVCPTRHHLRMVFQTSYDTYPLDTRRWKRTWLPRLADGHGVLLFDHDPELFGATIKADDKEEFVVDQRIPADFA